MGMTRSKPGKEVHQLTSRYSHFDCPGPFGELRNFGPSPCVANNERPTALRVYLNVIAAFWQSVTFATAYPTRRAAFGGPGATFTRLRQFRRRIASGRRFRSARFFSPTTIFRPSFRFSRHRTVAYTLRDDHAPTIQNTEPVLRPFGVFPTIGRSAIMSDSPGTR